MHPVQKVNLKDDEVFYLEKNNIDFKDFAHETIEKEQTKILLQKKREKQNLKSNLLHDFSLFCMGVLCFSFTYITMPFFVFLLLNIIAAFLMCVGVFFFIKDYRIYKSFCETNIAK